MEERRAEVPSLRVEAIVVCRSGEVDGAVGRMEREKERRERRKEARISGKKKGRSRNGTLTQQPLHTTPTRLTKGRPYVVDTLQRLRCCGCFPFFHLAVAHARYESLLVLKE